jgi:hypothetical protein
LLQVKKREEERKEGREERRKKRGKKGRKREKEKRKKGRKKEITKLHLYVQVLILGLRTETDQCGLHKPSPS